MDYWKIIISMFEKWRIPYDGNMVVDGADELKGLLLSGQEGIERGDDEYFDIVTSLFAKWKIQYTPRMIWDGVDILKDFLSPAHSTNAERVDANILEETLKEEKRQFTDKEYKLLHDLHGVNSPYGIGYYMGRLAQKVEDEKRMVKWHPASEAPTEHWEKNNAISPIYLVKCAGTGTDGTTILGYANYTFVSNAWIDCFHATEHGNWRVVAWTEDRL